MPLDIKIATFHTEFASNETVMEGLADAKEMMIEVFNEHPLIKGCVDNILAMDMCTMRHFPGLIEHCIERSLGLPDGVSGGIQDARDFLGSTNVAII